ncbi:MAG: MATE family efflux transporter [Paludibacteraceae bacterium]|nr:MATE family efflux transporter [Paludibacteraceae bacterium]MBQ2189393.1 MATE family efflux transporter [Paludibacteraceae bacterium]MBQ2520300.1 MATE family efflux transporter [Paludibacteraceae bacterium]MBQ4017846.1 MATE family efflux transporter [Paludibacteraceae bacterium]MBQ5378639.1 MATE family efflux transporter [Paludibacteraceae bacterium]
MSRTTELGTAPIHSLLFKYALPAIIAMTASSLYNIVDSIYIGHGCGALALGALTVAKPFMDICAAFGSLVGVGASSLLAIYLGEKDYDRANRVLGNVIVLNIILSAIVMVIGLIWLDPILLAFGASEDTLLYAREYMEIILYGNILTHIYFGLNAMLRSAGHPRFSMTATIVAVVVNIILDPIFIFGLDMGVRGAALATVISQAVAVVWQFTKFMDKNELVRFHRGIWRLNRHITLRALAIGMSPFLYNIAHCFVVIIINNQLKQFGGDMAIASYGVINRLTFVFAMIVMGLNQGMQPIAGYNYGAKQIDRVLKSFYITCAYATGVMGIVFVLGECFPELVTKMFTHDSVLIAQTIKPMRIICSTMLIIGFQMVTGNLFTSIGKAGKAIFLSLTRQVIYLIPLALLLPMAFAEPLDGVWWAIPASDTLSAVTAIIVLLTAHIKVSQKV